MWLALLLPLLLLLRRLILGETGEASIVKDRVNGSKQLEYGRRASEALRMKRAVD